MRMPSRRDRVRARHLPARAAGADRGVPRRLQRAGPLTTTGRHRLPSAPAASREGTMSLSTIEASLREDITTVEAKVRSILDEHLPALATAAADAESDPIAQALENTFLDDDEKTLVASLI